MTSRRYDPPRTAGRRRPTVRRRGRRGRRLLGLLGIAAAGVGLWYLASNDLESRALPPELLPPPLPDPDAEPAAGGRHVEGPAGRLFVRTAGGEGSGLLLLHGLGGTGGHWWPQLAALGGVCRVAAPDLRGHGRSADAGEGDGNYSVAAHAGDVLAIAAALDLERFVVAGHGFGAWVALELAAAHPERVLALALVDPGGDTSGESAAAVAAAVEAVSGDPRNEFALHYRDFLHGARPATSRRVLADLAATTEAALARGFAEAMRYPARARLAAYPGPVLCLASSLNHAAGSLTRTVSGLATEWLAPSSHWVMLDRPEQTSGLLGELVQSTMLTSR